MEIQPRAWVHACNAPRVPEVLVFNHTSRRWSGTLRSGTATRAFSVDPSTPLVVKLDLPATACGRQTVNVEVLDAAGTLRWNVAYKAAGAEYTEFARARPPASGARGLFLMSAKVAELQGCQHLEDVEVTWRNTADKAVYGVVRRTVPTQQDTVGSVSVPAHSDGPGRIRGVSDVWPCGGGTTFPDQTLVADERDCSGSVGDCAPREAKLTVTLVPARAIYTWGQVTTP